MHISNFTPSEVAVQNHEQEDCQLVPTSKQTTSEQTTSYQKYSQQPQQNNTTTAV